MSNTNDIKTQKQLSTPTEKIGVKAYVDRFFSDEGSHITNKQAEDLTFIWLISMILHSFWTFLSHPHLKNLQICHVMLLWFSYWVSDTAPPHPANGGN